MVFVLDPKWRLISEDGSTSAPLSGNTSHRGGAAPRRHAATPRISTHLAARSFSSHFQPSARRQSLYDTRRGHFSLQSFSPAQKNDFEEANQRVCEETAAAKNHNEGIRCTSEGKNRRGLKNSSSTKASSQNLEDGAETPVPIIQSVTPPDGLDWI